MRVDKPQTATKGEKEMARNMVTRTVKGLEVNVKVVDTATEQIVADKVVLASTCTSKNEAGESALDMDKVKKAVTKALPEGKILVSITDVTNIDKCYGVPTAKFMELAVELDPATRSKLETETDDTENTEE